MARVLADGARRRAGGDRRPDRVAVGQRDAGDGDGRRGSRHRASQDRRRGRRRMCDDERFHARGARLASLDDVLAAGVVAGDDRDRVAGRRARVVGGDAPVPCVEERAGRARDRRSGREARPGGVEGAEAVDDDLVLAPELVPRPEVHLHPRHAARTRRRLGRRPEVGVVRAAAVGSLGPNVVAAESEAAVVGGLEVPGRLVHPVAEEEVVERVVREEQVRDDGVAVVLRMLVQVGGEVEVETGPAVRVEAHVGGLVVVLVEVRVRVVPLRVQELGPGDAVRVVPAERRRDRVGRVVHEVARPVVRALQRELERPVARAVDHRARREHVRGQRGLRRRAAGTLEGRQRAEAVVRRPVVLGEQLAGLGVDGRVPEVRSPRSRR